MTSLDAAAPRGASAAAPTSALMLGAVFVGGVLGTAARMGIGAAVAAADPDTAAVAEFIADTAIDDVLAFSDPVLIATLGINLLGSLLLGLVVGAHWPARLAWLRAGIGTGFLGAFTTFSFVMLAFAVLGLSSAWAWGLLILGLVGGLLLAAVGRTIGGAIGQAPEDGPPGSDSASGSPVPGSASATRGSAATHGPSGPAPTNGTFGAGTDARHDGGDVA